MGFKEHVYVKDNSIIPALLLQQNKWLQFNVDSQTIQWNPSHSNSGSPFKDGFVSYCLDITQPTRLQRTSWHSWMTFSPASIPEFCSIRSLKVWRVWGVTSLTSPAIIVTFFTSVRDGGFIVLQRSVPGCEWGVGGEVGPLQARVPFDSL